MAKLSNHSTFADMPPSTPESPPGLFVHIAGLELIDAATHRFILTDCTLEPLEIDYAVIRDALMQARHARITSEDADAAIEAMLVELQACQLARILAKRISISHE